MQDRFAIIIGQAERKIGALNFALVDGLGRALRGGDYPVSWSPLTINS